MLSLKKGLYLFTGLLLSLSCEACSEKQDLLQPAVRKAVIIVDVQKDFTEGGSLAVPNSGKDYVEAVEAATKAFKSQGFKVLATQDWHPVDHISFYANHAGKKFLDVIPLPAVEQASFEGQERLQTLWPPHCVQYTEGAIILLPTDGEDKLVDVVVQKGANPLYDSYSGFQDDGGVETSLNEVLKLIEVEEVIIYGVATDYCVKATVMDALKRGYKVALITNLCRGVGVDTSALAIRNMKKAGASIYVTLEDFFAVSK